MAYKVVLTRKAVKEAGKLEKRKREGLKEFLRRVAEDPRSQGEPLKGRFKGEWRYKRGKLRILCFIDDGKQELVVLRVRWRKDAYR